MPTAALTLTLVPEQVVAMNLSDPAQERVLLAIAQRLADSKALAEVANRTYHMGTVPTATLDYDDRLTARLNCCASTAYAYLELGAKGKEGGLRHIRLGKKYHITERDVRRFEGETIAGAA